MKTPLRGLDVLTETRHCRRLLRQVLAPLANFAISAAIALALLAKLFLVEARLPQLSTVCSISVMVMIGMYSDTARPELNYLREC